MLPTSMRSARRWVSASELGGSDWGMRARWYMLSRGAVYVRKRPTVASRRERRLSAGGARLYARRMDWGYRASATGVQP